MNILSIYLYIHSETACYTKVRPHSFFSSAPYAPEIDSREHIKRFQHGGEQPTLASISTCAASLKATTRRHIKFVVVDARKFMEQEARRRDNGVG